MQHGLRPWKDLKFLCKILNSIQKVWDRPQLRQRSNPGLYLQLMFLHMFYFLLFLMYLKCLVWTELYNKLVWPHGETVYTVTSTLLHQNHDFLALTDSFILNKLLSEQFFLFLIPLLWFEHSKTRQSFIFLKQKCKEKIQNFAATNKSLNLNLAFSIS